MSEEAVVCYPPCLFQVPIETDDEGLRELLSTTNPLSWQSIENIFPGLLAAATLACNAIEEETGSRPKQLIHKREPERYIAGTIQALRDDVQSALFVINPSVSWPPEGES
jgi:hypothetical protein